MRLLRPEMVAWLLAIPVAALCWLLHFQFKWRHRRTETGLPGLSRRTRPRHDVVVFLLTVSTMACIAVAMMRPQLRWEGRTPTFERRDLVLILDRSVSMGARDVLPSRFGRAVQEIQGFLRRKPDTIDRVALVGFASTAVVLSYPTADLSALFFYLDWVREDTTPLYGTDIAAALARALDVVQRDPQPLSPVFVLISDGDDQSVQLLRAMAAVRRTGIHVHCIGIGSYSAVPIPVAAGEGRDSFLRDESGSLVTTRFDETTLQQIAASTGGRYFRSVTGHELVSALDAIAGGERRQNGWITTVEYRDLYAPLLAAAAVLSLGLVVRL